MSELNPFDELDGELTPAELAALQNQPMPTLAERFRANAGQAFYTGTLAGGIQGQGAQAFERDQTVAAYEAMPQWETPLDAVAALAGQLYGSASTPESLLGAGSSLTLKALQGAGVKTAGFAARAFGGAVDAAVQNAVVDAAVQGMEIKGGDRDGFDATQTAIATGLGAAIGGAAAGLTAPKSATPGDTPAKAPELTPDAQTPVQAVPQPEPAKPPVGAPDAPETAIAQDVPGQIPDNATVQPAPRKAPAIVAQDPPTLGEVLDGEARKVRGLPERPIAELRNSTTANNINDIPGENPQDLAALSVGPRTGMLGRDQAGVAATPAEIVEPPAFTRLKDTAEELMAGLDAVAVRLGRIAKPKADGIYKVKSGVIRLKTPDDFDVLAHELGHHVEEHVGPSVQKLMAQFEAELKPMAYAGADPKVLLKEGFAEYMRVMVTNPAYAKTQAPQFDAAFRAMLAKDEPAVLAALDKAAGAWKGWLNQSSATAVASTIATSREPKWFGGLRKDLARYGLGRTIAERVQGFYSAALDDLNPLNQAVRGLAKVFEANTGKTLDLKVADDAYKLARLARGGFNAGHMDVMHGVVPYRGTAPASSSLRDALVKAMGGANALSKWDEARITQFGSYLWSRRAMGEWERFEQGLIPNRPDKLTKGDHAQNIADLEKAFPQFADAAAMVHDFALALWTKKKDAGLISHEQWQAGLEIKDYVPGLRAFDHAGDAAGGGAGGDRAKSGFVKRFQGSTRDVLNPVESLLTDAYETANAIARNDVIKALARMADRAGPGSGAFAELIPSHQMKGMGVDALEALQRAAQEQGIAEADWIAMRDMVEGVFGDDTRATIFRPAVINEKGEAIAFFRDGGELRALRLADGQFGKDMMTALNGMTRKEGHVFIQALAKPAAVLRTGITAAPEFILANFIRDQVMSAIFYGQPLKRLTGAIKGMGDEMFGRDAARAYNAAGGIMGGANVAAAMDTRLRVDLQNLRRKGWGVRVLPYLTEVGGVPVPGFPIMDWMRITELSETGMRLGLFKGFFDEAKGRGLSEIEATLEAAWRARDHIDFDRRGSVMTGVARLIPFLNASLQGLDKTWRTMIQPLYREAVTVAEQRARADAVKAHARLMALTVFSMGLHALMSKHEEYNDLSPQTRASHWMVKWGDKWLAIPKPFDLGAVINLGDAAWDAMVKRDPRWADAYVEGLLEVTLPPNVMEGNPLIRTAYEAKTGTTVRDGRPIVPPGMEGLEPWLQFTAKTSDLSRTLGKAVNQSPAMIDHMIVSFTGSLGRTALSLYDYAAADKPLPGWDDMPFTRRFIKDGARGASSTRAFWELVSTRTGKLEGARDTFDKLMEGGDAAGAADYVAGLDGVSKAWVMIGSAKPEVRRLHPMTRARSAVTAINDLRRDIMQTDVDTAQGPIQVSAQDRGVVDDILEDLAMAEARNALVMMKVPGWEAREVIEVAGYYRELKTVSPPLAQALADRFATAKVLPLDTVEKLWPEVERRLKRDGGKLQEADLVARARAAGFEMDGMAMKRKQKAKVVLPPSP